MLLAIRFFEPLFGALIVVPFFGLPPWLLRFKLPPCNSKEGLIEWIYQTSLVWCMGTVRCLSKAGGLFSFFYGFLYKVNSLLNYFCSGYSKGFGTPLQLVCCFFCQPQSKIYAFGNFLVRTSGSRRHGITSLFAPTINILLLEQKVKRFLKIFLDIRNITCYNIIKR